jgi:hypothetical protein
VAQRQFWEWFVLKGIESVQGLLSKLMRSDGGLDYGSADTLILHVFRGGVHGIIRSR